MAATESQPPNMSVTSGFMDLDPGQAQWASGTHQDPGKLAEGWDLVSSSDLQLTVPVPVSCCVFQPIHKQQIMIAGGKAVDNRDDRQLGLRHSLDRGPASVGPDGDCLLEHLCSG